MNPFYSTAVEYVIKHGFSVIPCAPKDKRPLTTHGCKDASRDLLQIEKWWAQWPNANVGIVCGLASANLIVLDVDGEDGQTSLRNLENTYEPLPGTPRVLTGKGEQYYFKSNQSLKNFVGIFPGIDIRAEGGYVVAPPSIHPNGKTYQWEACGRLDEMSIAPIPAWLLKILESKIPKETPAARDWKQFSEKVKCGTRNQALASIAGHLFRKNVDVNLAYALLTAWNNTNLEQPLTEQELDRTINSIAGAEIRRRERKWVCRE